jgi:hypothetical protein
MRKSSIFFSFLVLSSATAALAVDAPRPPISPKAQKVIAAIEPTLGDYELAADGIEKELQPLLKSADDNVALSVDSALLQIQAIRSLRRILTEQPEFVTWHINQEDTARWKDAAVYFLDCARAGKDPFAKTIAGTRPFRSKIDGQLLLYQFRLPPDYDSGKKYPLWIDLHAGGGFTWMESWVKGKPSNNPREASSDGAIHISPAGRQHVGMGEIAILDAIADATKHYSVDEDRLVIGGWSWGGTGGFHFATLLPDHFAAAYSGTGGGNYNVPIGNLRFDAYLLSDNLCGLPFWVCDTPGDGHYRANHAFADELRAAAGKYPGSYPNLEVTDPHGGHGKIEKTLQDQGWKWLAGQVRNRFPKRVVYKTACLRYDGAYWAHIDTVDDAAQPARIEAEITPDAGCRVSIANADGFHLDFDAKLTGAAAAISVRINDSAPIAAPIGKTVNFRRIDEKWGISPDRYPAGLVKKHGLSGPIQDVFMEHPVLMVRGSADGNDPHAATRMTDHLVTRLFGPGDGSGFLRTGFERKTDEEVSDQDIADKNLILIGTPKENRLLARIAGSLPVQFLADGVQIGAAKYQGPGVGLVMVYPNPLNPQRYILLMPPDYSGLSPLDFPDYVVLAPSRQQKQSGRVLARGMFDARWKLMQP